MFDDFTINWNGKTALIPGNRLLMAIARVEEVITLGEIMRYQVVSTVPLARISQAYGTLLRYANIECTDEDVYESMFGDEPRKAIIGAISGLLVLMVPPSRRVATQTANPLQPTSALSSTSTKRQSGKQKSSRRRSSGRSPSPNSGGSSILPNR